MIPRDRSRTTGFLSAALVLVVATTSAAPAFAADVADKARAQQLFDDAKRLMDQSNYAEACPKLEESQRLDPADGTLLRYAWCEEELGKYATAWVLFKDGLARVKAVNHAVRIKFATDHLAAIEPKLSKVKINVSAAAAAVPGLEVRWDGNLLGKTEWNAEFPVDPGDHALSAAAPGRQTWKTSVGIGAVADRRAVEVPVLPEPTTTTVAANAPQPSTTTTDVSTPSSNNGSSTAAWVAFGSAAALLTTAIVARVEMNAALSTMKDDCAANLNCLDDDRSRVRRWEAISWVAGIGAIAAGGAGIYFATRPSTSGVGNTHSAALRLTPTGTGITLSGAVSW